MLNAHAAMKPGNNLTQTTRASLELLAPSIDKLGRSSSAQIELQQWVTEVLMASITGGIFRPRNPYKDPELAKNFWFVPIIVDLYKTDVSIKSRISQDIAAGLISLPLPRLTCAKAYAAREKIATAFENYYTTRGCDDASSWVRGATEASNSYGISNEDKAHLDLSNSHAILANTIPAGFWAIYHIFSDPTVLDEVRSALMHLLTIRDDSGRTQYELDVTQIRDVPILRSVLSETLPHYANGTGTRIVVEDTMLDNRYLLKKDSFVFLPNRCYYLNPAVWGPTVDDFDARRFISFKPPGGSFRPFGGGANLCPGRFFAMNGILAMFAMLALRYDLKAVPAAWVHPDVNDSNMTLLVQPSKAKTLVRVAPREEWVGGEWAFKMS